MEEEADVGQNTEANQPRQTTYAIRLQGSQKNMDCELKTQPQAIIPRDERSSP